MNPKRIVDKMMNVKYKRDKYSKKYDQYRAQMIELHAEKKNPFDDQGFLKGTKASIVVNKTEKLIYNVAKLKRKVPYIFKKVVTRDIQIADQKAFLKLMKKYGVPTKELKETLNVEYAVNEQKLQDLFEIGELSEKDIKGCYTIEPGRTIVTVKAVSDDEED